MYAVKNIYQILLTGHFSNSQQRGQIVSIYEPSTSIVLTPLKEEKISSNKKITEHFPTQKS